ncbi:hypothetical protein GCM10011609_74020 [Lentzea pudingi]|uniref:Uncharacterized protein n=1 Tax=Lentzea pudingi TaxID=1789439 RepID=A0ABQ2IMY2_9PSEU|nr:hypothetical protein [Lentzea pudingi]GGN21903.1 hypothetical protein GCM10011609_74020 [Lentzea pudingi]
MKPGGIVVWTAGTLVAGTVAYFIWLPEGDWRTDQAAEDAVHCLTGSQDTGTHNEVCGAEIVRNVTLKTSPNEPYDPHRPNRRLIVRIHLDELTAGFSYDPAVTACYRYHFGDHGLVGRPSRMDCPE